MDVVKSWTFSFCIVLIISVIISTILPSGKMADLSKILFSLFIIISIAIPFTDSEINLDFPNFDIENYQTEEENDTYKNSIETQIKIFLEDNEIYSSCVNCDIDIADNEITINKIVISISDEYDKTEVKNTIYNGLGYVAEVNYIGE